MNYDAAVVGAGPGGSTAARMLAEKGIKTALVEGKTMPRHKTCAGAVSGKAFHYLDSDFYGLAEDKLTNLVFRYNYGEGVGYRAPSPFAYTVTRDKFDHYLARRAETAGADLFQGSYVREITREHGFFHVHTGDTVLKTRVIVGADGASSMVARTFQLTRKVLGIGLETIVPLDKVREKDYRQTSFLDYGFVPHGYGWIFSKSDHLNVGMGTFQNRSSLVKRLLHEYIEYYFPQLNREGLPLYGHLIPIYSGGSLSGDGVLLVGDAAGLVDPFSGEGIHYAMESGDIAAGVIEGYLQGRGELREYDKKIRDAILSQLKVAGLIGNLFYNMSGCMHRYLVRKRRVVREFARMVAGESSYSYLGKWLLANILKEAVSRVPEDEEFFVPASGK